MTLSQYSDENYLGACLKEKQSEVLQALQDTSTVLKNGKTSKVWYAQETGLIVKKFKARNKFSLIEKMRPSRAERAAKNGLFLQEKGFLTPRVLAHFRDKEEAASSYLVTDAIIGRPLEKLLLAKELEPKIVLRWLARLHNAEIYHRDLKRSNLYINGDQVGIIDLDSLKIRPLWPDQDAGKDLGMLLSSAGGFFEEQELENFADIYARARGITGDFLDALTRRAIEVAKRRFDRGSTPKVGGWPRA